MGQVVGEDGRLTLAVAAGDGGGSLPTKGDAGPGKPETAKDGGAPFGSLQDLEGEYTGVTWGTYAVQGTWDGNALTVTQPPIMLALSPYEAPLLDWLGAAPATESAAANLPISPRVRYHSILGQADMALPRADASDGIVPYASAHLAGAAFAEINGIKICVV